MAGLLGGGGAAVKSVKYTGLQIQTSTNGLPIPIVWGANAMAPNLIWYGDFKGKKQSTGKGGGAKGGGTKTYTAAVILAMCEGPIDGLGKVWQNTTDTTLAKLNLTLALGTAAQTAPAWMVSRHPTEALPYSLTAYVASSKYKLGSSAALPSHSFEVHGLRYNVTAAGYPDANPKDILTDYLTSPQYGAGLATSYLGDLSDWGTYCLAQLILFSPCLTQSERIVDTVRRWATLTNSWIFWNGGQIKVVPLASQTVTGVFATYTPNNNALYDLTYEDFVMSDAEAGPVAVTRIDPFDAYNSLKVSYRNRANRYSVVPAEYKDQSLIDRFGVQPGSDVQAEEICDADIAQTVANLIGNRMAYIRNTYEFTTGPAFILVEPGDILTLTDPNIGITQTAVRVKEVEENEEGNLNFICEEFPDGHAAGDAPAAEPWGGSTGMDAQADPGNVNTPMIFEPQPAAANSVPQVIVGLSGGANWGGADIYMSLDNVAYGIQGEINNASIQGTLTVALADATGLDTTNTIYVDCTASEGVIPAATNAEADAGLTQILVDGELIYFGAVAQGATEFKFLLTYLWRGQQGTAHAAHSIGGLLTYMDPNVQFVEPLPPAFVGVPIYFKFASFNQFNNQQQDLSGLPYYLYTPSGTGYFINPPTSLTLSQTNTVQPDGAIVAAINAGWTASTGPLVGSYELQYSSNAGATYNSLTIAAPAVSMLVSPAIPAQAYMIRVRAISQNGLALSTFATGTITTTSTVTAVPTAPAGLAATGFNGVSLTWTGSTDLTVLYYKLYRGLGTSVAFGSCSLVAQIPAGSVAWIDGTVSSSTAYTYYLVAHNAAPVSGGDSSPSAGVNVTSSSSVPTVVGGVVDGISAVGTTQGTAYVIPGLGTYIFTSVSAGTPNGGAVLPAIAGTVVILNRGTIPMQVYPPSGGTIEALATNAAATVPANGETTFSSSAGTAWRGS